MTKFTYLYKQKLQINILKVAYILRYKYKEMISANFLKFAIVNKLSNQSKINPNETETNYRNTIFI